MQHEGAEFPVFIAQTGVLNGRRWIIDRELVIGRESSCEIVIADRQVSRYHARITPQDRGVQLEDLGSKNGTFVNGESVMDPVILQDGDEIQIALVQSFTFLSSDATLPLENLPLSRAEEGKLHLDVRSRRVWVGVQEVLPPLSVPQFKLLQVLFEHEGQVVSRNNLIDGIWGDDEADGVSEEALDALVRRLRDRLASFDPDQAYIITVRGHGLRLENSA